MITVPAENLLNGMELARDLFLTDNDFIPFLKKNTVLNDKLIGEIRRRGFIAINIKGDRKPTLAELSLKFDMPKGKPVISEKLKGESITMLEEVFSAFAGDIHESSKAVVHKIDDVVGELINALQADKNTIVSINDLKSFDDYTYHHSLSVAVLSIAIAEHIRFSPEQTHRIGVCAMMHDIGKISVPIQIINKPSRLDNDELSIIKTHPSAGFEVLSKSGLLSEDILQGVLHHHEKSDGTGYPDGLSGESIPIYSKIISIADVYDALTSNRPYRVPMQPAEAIEHIMGDAGHAFDFDLVTAFMQKLELYPLGGIVELSTGLYAAVLKNENQLRPVVKTENGTVLDLANDPACSSIVIDRLIS